jgi:hypothetical protein
MSLKAVWQRVLEGEVAAWPLARTRIIVGALAITRAFEAARVLWPATAPDTLRLPYVSFMPELTRAEVPWLAGIWLAAAAAFTLGWRTRISGSVLCLVIARSLTSDQQGYSSHLYLLLLLVLILTVGRSAAVSSLDARRVGRRYRVPGWPVWLLAVQGTLVYGYAALAKLIPAYLSGAVICAHFGWLNWDPAPVYLCAGLAIASIVTELFLVVALWRRRLWPLACVVGVGLHVAMVVMLTPDVRLQLIIFAGEMLVLYPLYPIAADLIRGESHT